MTTRSSATKILHEIPSNAGEASRREREGPEVRDTCESPAGDYRCRRRRGCRRDRVAEREVQAEPETARAWPGAILLRVLGVGLAVFFVVGLLSPRIRLFPRANCFAGILEWYWYWYWFWFDQRVKLFGSRSWLDSLQHGLLGSEIRTVPMYSCTRGSR
jgi:hypothetical protein